MNLLVKAYTALKELEMHTKDPLIKESVDDDGPFTTVIDALEEAMKVLLFEKYLNELEKGGEC